MHLKIRACRGDTVLHKISAMAHAIKGINPSIIPQRLIPGILTRQNVIDWGWQGLIAYGNGQVVVILDPKTMQVVQTLIGHRYAICKLKWSRENYHHDSASPYSLRVASVDTSGHVVVWDVTQGSERAEFSERGRPINDLEWLGSQDASHDLLIAVHFPNILCLWNADTGTKLWSTSYSDMRDIRSVTIDPFEPTRFAALGSDCILFVHDFSISKRPTSSGKKYYITEDREQRRNSIQPGSNLAKMAVSGIKFLMGEEVTKERGSALSACRQLTYLPSMRHHLAVVFATEILIIDVNILEAVATIPLEPNGSHFMQVLPVCQRPALVCMHENGSVSFRIKRSCKISDELLKSQNESPSAKYDLFFDTVCHSEPFRITNRVRPVGAAMCPVSERSTAILISDGRIFVWKVMTSHKDEKSMGNARVYSLPRHLVRDTSRSSSLSDIIAPSCSIDPQESIEQNSGVWSELTGMKYMMVGILNSLSCQVTAIRMCPPLTQKNWPHYRPLLAVGLQSGNILIYDLGTGKLMHEYCVHTCEVRGIEWSGLRSIVSFGYPQNASQSTSNVTNEVLATNLLTGRTMPFRVDKSAESPINMMKISNKKQYLLIIFYDKPIELWDVKTRCLLRVLPKDFPTIHSVEWAPSQTIKRSEVNQDSEPLHFKEHLVLTDASATLYHCIAEGSSFKRGSRIPHVTERNSTITSISWKHDYIFMGDTDGVVSLWNLKSKIAKTVPTHRGWIRKVQFGPGKGNLQVGVLFEDGLEVWDADDAVVASRIVTPKHLPKILHFDWCASDKVILSCENGQILVMDSGLRLPPMNIPTSDLYYWKPISNPYLLQTKPGLALKAMLQHGKLDVNSVKDDVPNGADMENAIEAFPQDFKVSLQKCSSTLTRCSLVANLYGDESEVKFWEMVSNSITNSNVSDVNLDTLSECEKFRLYELQRCFRHLMINNTPKQAKQCVRSLLFFGEAEQAIQLGLETDPTSPSYYQDCLKSCLIATLQDNKESAQSNVKLIATNLIANDKLLEGVEILCMLGKHLDACRYLATNNQWELAVWLAKVHLKGLEYEEIMERWAKHLSSPKVNNKSKAILVYVSLKKFVHVLDTLYQMRHFDRAAMFALICQEMNLFSSDKPQTLIDSVHGEYARYLQHLGCKGELVNMHESLRSDKIDSDDTNSSETSSFVMNSSGSNMTDDFENIG